MSTKTHVDERSRLLSSSESTNSTIAASDEADLTSEGISTTRLAIILASNWADSSVVATLLVPMTDDFSSLKTLSWLGTSYIIAATAMIPLSGRLTDIFGRRVGAIGADVTFAIGALVCGMARTEGVLIFGRVLSGLGAGPARSVSSFITADLVPQQKRGVVQGITLVCMGAGTAIGGFLGGWIAEQLSWRWAFLLQLPFLVLGTVLVICFVETPPRPLATDKTPTLRKIDFLGSLSLVASLTMLLVGLNAGGNLVPWTHVMVLISLPLSALLFGCFLYIEACHAHDPIIPLRLFKIRTVSATCLYHFFGHLAAFGIIFYVPVYAQLRGSSASKAGTVFVAQAFGSASSAILAGWIIRRTGHYNLPKWTSIICTLTAFTGFVMLGNDTPWWQLMTNMFVHGFAFGNLLVVGNIAVISSIDRDDEAVALSALTTIASVGSVLGISAGSAVFQNVLNAQLRQSLGSGGSAEGVIEQVRQSFGSIPSVPGVIRPQVQAAFMASVHGVFKTTLIVTCLSALAALWIRQNRLHMTMSQKD
ncbi:MAG: hypothetical protein Q9162_000317 [Coniocarpon cinnabarinum]